MKIVIYMVESRVIYPGMEHWSRTILSLIIDMVVAYRVLKVIDITVADKGGWHCH
jgi:hypothetical protein